MQDKQSVYDKDGFFDLYQKLRSNPNSLNEIVEKPTMLGLVGGVSGKRILDLGCGCGEHLKLYLERGAAFVAGIDLSQAMLQQAAKNLAEFRPHFWSHYHFQPMQKNPLLKRIISIRLT